MKRTFELTENQINTIIKALSIMEIHYVNKAKELQEIESRCRFDPEEQKEELIKIVKNLIKISSEAAQLNIDINQSKLDV